MENRCGTITVAFVITKLKMERMLIGKDTEFLLLSCSLTGILGLNVWIAMKLFANHVLNYGSA